MSFKDELKRKIRDLEEKIAREEGEKLDLEVQLNKLRLTEFEEDMKEEQEPKITQRVILLFLRNT
jgi:cell division protein FtsL